MIKFINRYRDPDGTEKYIFRDSNGTIEITRIKTKQDRDIYCVPSLYGCTLGCTFCFLTTEQISLTNKKVSYDTINSCLNFFEDKKDKRQISIMGVGDPSLNLELIKEASDKEEMVSMASIFPKTLPQLPSKVKIHYSLHSPIKEKRLEIMPSARKDINEVMEYLLSHEGNTEVHYTLIDGQNDSEDELEAMVKLFEKYPINLKFLDFKESGGLKKSPRLDRWMNTLKDYTTVEFYNPPGEKIQGSCGQFTKVFYQQNYENTEEFQQFNENYAF